MTSSRQVYSNVTLQLDVIGALIMRELHVRFGRNNVGYLWLIGEPLLLASVIGSLHAFQGSHGTSDMAPIPMSIVGYCIFIMFRGIFGRAESLIEANAPLLYHKMISPFNLSVARAIIEGVGCFCSMIILLGVCIALNISTLPARPLYLFAAAGMMLWFSFAMGLNCTVITYERPTLGRLVHPFSYFMMPLSGAFIPIDWCPKVLADIQEWNPLALIFEIARYGMFENAPDQHLFPAYACGAFAILTYTGLVSMRKLPDRIHLT
jgi:capsular polysaccharide transport system permease protein